MKKHLLFVILLVAFNVVFSARAQEVVWWLTGSTIKVTPLTAQPADVGQSMHLHAARQEYAPFQIVIAAQGEIPAPTVAFPAEYFDLTLYEEFFVPIQYPPEEPEIFSLTRLVNETTIPDGLRPLADTLTIDEGMIGVVWADLYVKPETPPGDYTLTVTLPDAGERTVTVTVYPVDLAPSASMSIIVPLSTDEAIPFFAPDDEEGYQRAINAVLMEHDFSIGTLSGRPELTDSGWDFSMFDAELAALTPGMAYFVPNPYDYVTEEYAFPDEDGEFYTYTDFEDEFFVQQALRYYTELAAYLQSQNRLEGAFAYPYDENVWVADEPDHVGAEGYEHLGQWTAIIRQAGLPVLASRVAPLPIYSPNWLPAEQITNNVHVHIDLFDSAPGVFAQWSSVPGFSDSVYLNQYGDLIDMPSSIHRGMMWHLYARDVRIIAGYEATEWVDEDWNYVDGWTNVEDLYPHGGYGAGALVWPGPLPSLRLKVLREGVEDARLLDLYATAAGAQAARDFAACLTPGALADQNPPADLWDNAHTALLAALSSGTVVDSTALCIPPLTFSETQTVIDLETQSPDDWSVTNVQSQVVESPFGGNALQFAFLAPDSIAEFWFGSVNWSGWDALLIDVRNDSPAFVELDVAVGDAEGNYLLLRYGAINIGPNSVTTLMMPLVIPYASDTEEFDWSQVAYFDLAVGTDIERTDGFGDEYVFDTGARTLTFDNIRLARIQR